MKKSPLACSLMLCCASAFAQQTPAKVQAKPAAPANKPAAAQNPDIASARRLLDKGQLDEALKATAPMTLLHPEPKDVERLRGMAFYLKARFEEADAAFQKAIAQDPSDKEAIQLRGATLFRMGKAAQAIPLLEQSHANLTRINLDGTYVLALCYMNEHRYDDARHSFAALYRLQPDSAGAYLLLAKMLLRWKNSSEAQEMAQKSLSLNSRLTEAHLLLGQVFLASGRLDEALNEFEREVTINPLYGPVYDRLGDVYLQKNQYEKAQDALNEAILLEPDSTGPYILLGQVLLKRDNPSTAVVYLKRASVMDPGNELGHYLLGQAYRELGRQEEAKAEFQAVARLKAKSGQ